jgi:7,8-dihydropterin-6-yl-methyl-4-(beta-D-ribofuranosyl)aminobenzene 5'-phosphate synthase
VLFDTGGDGPTLLANMRRLGIAPDSIDAVVLSHIHGDHTGGLDLFLALRPGVTVYLPRSFPPAFRRAVERRGARVETVSGPARLLAGVYSTGEIGDDPKEQALIVDTASGPVVITGCAHPLWSTCQTARDYRGKDIHLLMGAFTCSASTKQNRAHRGAAPGVRRPSHCR